MRLRKHLEFIRELKRGAAGRVIGVCCLTLAWLCAAAVPNLMVPVMSSIRQSGHEALAHSSASS